MGGGAKQLEDSTVILPTQPTKERTVPVLRCAESVHGALGPGLEPLFYARALGLQLHDCRIAFERDAWIEIRFRGACLGRRRVDFLLEDLVLEVLSADRIGAGEVMRMGALLGAAKRPAGLLLNFGCERLESLRVGEAAAFRAAR